MGNGVLRFQFDAGFSGNDVGVWESPYIAILRLHSFKEIRSSTNRAINALEGMKQWCIHE